MNLYLLRHGEAEARQYDDAGRALTARGRLDVQDVARQLALRNVALDVCLHSPYLRTTQTAEVLLATLGVNIKPEAAQVLTPDHRAFQVLEHLRSVNAENVMLVTHNPLVSELFAVLTGADPGAIHIFNTSELNAMHCAGVCVGGATPQFRLQARRQ